MSFRLGGRNLLSVRFFSLSFQHVSRSSNFLVDALARAGASCTDLAFDL